MSACYTEGKEDLGLSPRSFSNYSHYNPVCRNPRQRSATLRNLPGGILAQAWGVHSKGGEEASSVHCRFKATFGKEETDSRDFL